MWLNVYECFFGQIFTLQSQMFLENVSVNSKNSKILGFFYKLWNHKIGGKKEILIITMHMDVSFVKQCMRGGAPIGIIEN